MVSRDRACTTEQCPAGACKAFSRENAWRPAPLPRKKGDRPPGRHSSNLRKPSNNYRPTHLVTASRQDAGVSFAHAEDYAHTIPGAHLVELAAPSHLFWLGPTQTEAQSAVAAFMGSNP